MFEHLILDRAKPWAITLCLILGLGILFSLSPMQLSTADGIPITLQSLLVVLVPILLGWKLGLTVVILYLVAGGLGLPVFAYGTSGWERFTGSTGGFLLAFPLAAVLVGWAAERIQNQRALMGTLCILAGQVLILALGLLWQRSIVPIAEPVWETLARLGPGLRMKTAFGGLVVVTLSRIIERNSKETPTIES
jgi:biotin transport system substrate-specific component